MSQVYFARYTLPSGSALQGTCIRGYACGRYLNNSAVNLGAINFGANLNQSPLPSCSVPNVIPISTVACGWYCWMHIYFSNTVPDAGVACSAGVSYNVGISNQGTTLGGIFQSTGTFVPHEYFSISANPYNVPIPIGQSTEVIFSATYATGDVMEMHHAYLEWL